MLDNLITNSTHAWLPKDDRSSGMYIVRSYRDVSVVTDIVTRRSNVRERAVKRGHGQILHYNQGEKM